MRSFYDFFPAIAQKETLNIQVTNEALPDGIYTFLAVGSTDSSGFIRCNSSLNARCILTALAWRNASSGSFVFTTLDIFLV